MIIAGNKIKFNGSNDKWLVTNCLVVNLDNPNTVMFLNSHGLLEAVPDSGRSALSSSSDLLYRLDQMLTSRKLEVL